MYYSFNCYNNRGGEGRGGEWRGGEGVQQAQERRKEEEGEREGAWEVEKGM